MERMQQKCFKIAAKGNLWISRIMNWIKLAVSYTHLRLCASMKKLYDLLSTDSPYKEGDHVEGLSLIHI